MGPTTSLFFFSSRRRHTRLRTVTGGQTCALPICPDPSVSCIAPFPCYRPPSDPGNLRPPMTADRSIVALQRPVRRQLDQVQDRLRGLFKTSIPILNEVGGHVLDRDGKKFRPTLLLLTAKLRGHLGEDAVVCATVVELVHAAALIHDDSVDRSHLRRGQPTVNGLWTDEMAIIMGDYMYAQSMSLLVENGHNQAMAILARVVSEMSCG